MKDSKIVTKVKGATEDLPVSDYAEIFIDAFVESEVLKEIPIASTMFGMGRAYHKFKHSIFKRKVEAFHAAVGSFTDDERKEFLLQLEHDGKKDEFVIELIDFIERVDSEQKARIIGGAFRRLVKKEMDISNFHDQVRITNSMILSDIHLFMHGYHNENIVEGGLGDILLIFHIVKKRISLAMRDTSLLSQTQEQYIKTDFALTGVGKCYLATLHQVYSDVIEPDRIFTDG